MFDVPVVSRRWLPAAIVVTVLCGQFARAEDDEDEEKVDIRPVNAWVTTKDGWKLRLTYYKSPSGKESPVVILLHDRRGNREFWRPFGRALQNNGFAAVAVDLRRHGESIPPDVAGAASGIGPGNVDVRPADLQKMVHEDLETVKAFLLEEHHKEMLNVRKTAIVAIGMSSGVALNFAANDWLKAPHADAPTLAARTPRGQDVRAMALITPEVSQAGLKTFAALKQLRYPAWGVSILVCVGGKHDESLEAATRIHERAAQSRDARQRMVFADFPTRLNGTDLMGRTFRGAVVDDIIIGFLTRHLKVLDPGDGWRDRRSRLTS